MNPSIKKYFWVQELTLYNIITTVIKEFRDSFNTANLTNLSMIDKNFSTMIPSTMQWLQVNFYPLWEPRFNYDKQEKISPRIVEMASENNDTFWIGPRETCLLARGRIHC